MAVTLMKLFENAEREFSVSLIAGSVGLNNTIRWVHILEDNGSKPFLHGNELIITTGIGHSDTKWMAGFVRTLKKANAAGIVIALGENIPSVPEDVILYCEHNAFPLFTAKSGTEILDLSYDLCRKIVGAERHDNAIINAFRAIFADPSAIKTHSKLLARAGFTDGSRYSVICAFPMSGNGEAADASELIAGNVAGGSSVDSVSRSVTFVHNGILTAVCQNFGSEEIRSLCGQIRDAALSAGGISVSAGISENEPGLTGIAAAYGQAEAAMVSALLSGKSSEYYGNIGIMKLILGVKDMNVLRAYVRENLGALLDHDAEHGTDLAHVLRVYLENNSSVNETAAIEKVHRNTVNSKMRTIREFLGRELDDAYKSRLIIAFLADDVLRIYDEKLSSLKKA